MAKVYYVTCPACQREYYLEQNLYQTTLANPKQRLICPFCKKEFSRQKETSDHKI